MKQYLKMVVWPREPIKKGKQINYRYAIVGMLVTDTPIENLSKPNAYGISEFVVDSPVEGMAEIIEKLKLREPKTTLSDASDVLVSLDMI